MKTVAWNHVCCPVDFSPESRAALTVAADLCRRLGARLTILHVHEGPGQAAWSEEAAAAGVRVSTATAQGNPETAIAAWANGSGADAIVMGTHGRTGRAHALVGSVAESTVRNARCPVMVVHADWVGLRRRSEPSARRARPRSYPRQGSAARSAARIARVEVERFSV